MKKYLLPIFLLYITTGAFAKISENERKIFVTEKLKKQPNLIATYIPGSICGSCSIGLFIHIGKLDAVDKKRLNKGLELDVKNQVLFIANKSNAIILIQKIKKAIEKAGYEPALWYQWDNDSLITHSFNEDI